MAPFLWMGFNSLKVVEPQQEDSLLSTTESPGIPGIVCTLKNQIFKWGVHEKTHMEGESPKKGGFGHFRFKRGGGLARKEGVFLRG